MNRNRFFSSLLVVLLVLFVSPHIAAQALTRLDTVEVLESAVVLRSAMAGGFNQPQFSEIDLNGDQVMDLIAFDRAGDVIIPFLNGGTANMIDYQYAPQFVDAFPAGLEDWLLARDYDCDGLVDLISGANDGMRVYKNISTGGNLAFQMVIDSVKSDRGAGLIHLFVPYTDIPAVDDIDGDGDLDVLTFDSGGNFVEFHQNMAVENSGNCAGLDLVLADPCWGKFRENALSQDVILNQTCKVRPGEGLGLLSGVHAGSSLATFDGDADGDKEIVIGDLLFDGLTYLRNGGTAAAALMDAKDNLFPSYDTPASLNIFPAPFFLDVNNDGKEDMLTSPNGTSISINYQNSWFYKNVDTGNGVQLSLETKNFLVDQMMDMGKGAYPVFFDYNADSLLDLVVGNFSFKTTASAVNSGLTLYENVGTKTDPRYELVTRDYGNFSTVFTPPIFGMTPAFGDLNNDGDLDLLIGDLDGKVHYFENIATSGQPANFVLASANYKGIDVGQSAAPMIVDIDRDGKVDLVIGEQWGNLNYYHNIGTNQVADFTANPDDNSWGDVDTEPVCCSGYSIPFIMENPFTGQYDLFVGSESGGIFYYEDIESHLGSTFPRTSGNFGNVRQGTRTAIFGGDINDDGQMDWVVGNSRGGMTLFTGNDLLAGEAVVSENLAEVKLFPNPSQGELNVYYQMERGKQMGISIADMQGRVIHQASQIGSSGQFTIAAQNWAPGVYFVSLKVDGAFAGVRKWVLTR